MVDSKSSRGPCQLLVSVRDSQEARSALAGGCDIIDVKEPTRGSLGMADVDKIQAVVGLVRDRRGASSAPALSAALGETREWLAAVPSIASGLRFAKLGMTGLADRSDWARRWRDVRERFDRSAGRPLDWVAVVYADWMTANAPAPDAIVDAAVRSACRAVLIDTWAKRGTNLFDWLDEYELHSLAQRTHEAGMRFALAGGLRRDLLLAVARIDPDIVAIRTAACHGGRRHGLISPSAIREFKTAMRDARQATNFQSAAADREG